MAMLLLSWLQPRISYLSHDFIPRYETGVTRRELLLLTLHDHLGSGATIAYSSWPPGFGSYYCLPFMTTWVRELLLLTLHGHLGSLLVFNGIRVAQSLELYVMVCRFSFGHWFLLQELISQSNIAKPEKWHAMSSFFRGFLNTSIIFHNKKHFAKILKYTTNVKPVTFLTSQRPFLCFLSNNYCS